MKLSKGLFRIIGGFVALAVCLSYSVFMVSAEQSSEEEKKPQKVYELITSNNPEYSCKISIYSRSIIVEGCFKSDPVKGVTLRNSGTISTTLKSKSDGSFTATINPSDALSDNDVVDITLKSGVHLTYRVGYANGWYFPDNNLSQQNDKVLEKIMPTSAKSWASYLTDELTEESVRKTLQEIKYLSDYIAKDIKGDYNKTVAIANWVSENIYYDRDARDTSVTADTICIKNVLERKRTVCAGYSNLFCALLEAQGIKAVNIKGTAVTDEITYENLANGRVNHEWCAVWLDGRWVVVDTVWNSGNKYQNGQYIKGKCYQKYIDITPLALSFDHCAYLAEDRNYFRATEYFEKQETTTIGETSTPAPETTVTEQTAVSTETAPDTTPINSDVSSPDVADTTIYPETSVPETVISEGETSKPDEVSSLYGDSGEQSQEPIQDSDSNLWLLIVILAVAAVALLLVNINYFISSKKGFDDE